MLAHVNQSFGVVCDATGEREGGFAVYDAEVCKISTRFHGGFVSLGKDLDLELFDADFDKLLRYYSSSLNYRRKSSSEVSMTYSALCCRKGRMRVSKGHTAIRKK